jgi:hypothetical protein
MSPRAALQEGVEHPLQAACGDVVFSTLDWHYYYLLLDALPDCLP